jgi:predicted DNA-binding transcriptional regulator AlpA
MTNKILIDIKGVEEAIGISYQSIRRGVEQGSIPKPVRVGGRVLWRVADLQQWSENLANNPVVKKETRGRKRMAI